VTWDGAKRRENLRKHRLDLADASRFDFNSAIIKADRDVAHEQRFRAIGYIGERLCFLVFTFRDDDEIHAISLRPATRPERRRYEGR
jgi:uncharacterized DUF497 family protein